MAKWLWFALLLHSLYVFFYEVSVQIICPVFCWVVCLYIIELYKSSLYILNTNPLLNKRFTNIFSQFVTWVSIFLKMTFNKQKVLISMKSILTIISFFLCALLLYLRIHCLTKDNENLLLCLVIFTVSSLTFKLLSILN